MYFAAILPAFVTDGVMENYLEHPKGLMTFIFYSLASLIIINLVDTTKNLEKVYTLLIIIGVIIGIICILQCFNLDPLKDYIYSFTGLYTKANSYFLVRVALEDWLRSNLSENARERSRQFSEERTDQETLRLYQDARKVGQ